MICLVGCQSSSGEAQVTSNVTNGLESSKVFLKENHNEYTDNSPYAIALEKVRLDQSHHQVDLSSIDDYEFVDTLVYEGQLFILMNNPSKQQILLIKGNEQGFQVVFDGVGKVNSSIGPKVIVNKDVILLLLNDCIIHLEQGSYQVIKQFNVNDQVNIYAVNKAGSLIGVYSNQQVYIQENDQVTPIAIEQPIHVVELRWIDYSSLGQCLVIIYEEKEEKKFLICNLDGKIIYSCKDPILNIGIGIDYVLFHLKQEDEIQVKKYNLNNEQVSTVFRSKQIHTVQYCDEFFVVEFVEHNERFIKICRFDPQDRVQYVIHKIEDPLNSYLSCHYNTPNNQIVWVSESQETLYLYTVDYNYMLMNTYVDDEDLFVIFEDDSGKVFGNQEFTNDDGSETFYYLDHNSNQKVQLGTLWGEGKGKRSLPLVEKISMDYVLFNHQSVINIHTGIAFSFDLLEEDFIIRYIDAFEDRLAIMGLHEKDGLLNYQVYEYNMTTETLNLIDEYQFNAWEHPWFDLKARYSRLGELYYDAYNNQINTPQIKKISVNGEMEIVTSNGTSFNLLNEDRSIMFYAIEDFNISDSHLLDGKKVHLDLQTKKKLKVLDGEIYESSNYIISYNYPMLSLYEKGEKLTKLFSNELSFENDFRDGGDAANIIIHMEEKGQQILLNVLHKEWQGDAYYVKEYSIYW